MSALTVLRSATQDSATAAADNPAFWIVGGVVVLIFVGMVLRVLLRNRLKK